MITVVTCTYRKEPHFDWLADSLALQTRPVDEWLVIDGYLWHDAERGQKLADAVRGRFPFRHYPPKPTRWQGPSRMTPVDFFALSNARNTALILAAGTRLVFTDDCAVLDTRWLERHMAWGEVGVAGTYDGYFHATVRDGALVSGTLIGDGDGRLRIMPAAGRALLGWAYGLNMSVPLDVALAVGGWDELYDGQAGSEDSDFAVRVERAGSHFVFDPTCISHQIADTHGVVCVEETKTLRRPNKTAVLRADGIAHFCNEALIERLLWDDQDRTQPLATWVDVRGLRAAYSAFGTIPETPLGPRAYWLDNEPLAEMT